MENKLKLVTYNIHHGLNPEAINQNILDLAFKGVDIFCLQELRKFENKKFLLDELLLSLGPKWQAEHFVEADSRDLGLCILWNSLNLQAQSFEPLLLPKLQKVYFYEKAFQKVASRYEKVGAKYSLPMQRAALIGDFNFKGKPLRITNMHLDWQGGFKHRKKQLQFLGEHLKFKPKSGGQIFCGDFNSLGFYKFSKRQSQKICAILGEGFHDAFLNKSTTSYLQMLDHIFVKNLSVMKAEILKYKGSDHFPLLAEIEI